MNRFDSKCALVTGAASGIGRATVERLAREGARVLAADVNEKLLLQEVGKLVDAGLTVKAHVLDVSDASACRAAVAAAVETFGQLDILCNIAGTLLMSSFLDIKETDWARVMGINVGGVFHLCHAAMPHLLKTKGNIVNIASTAGITSAPYAAVYSASKAAVVGLTKALAVEFAGTGVRVNAVAPGQVNTPMAASAPPLDVDMTVLLRITPLMQPAAAPEEIAGAVAYLASSEARFATGSVLVMDGGQTAI
ncbi:SDR family NAD(P)-dependent oxidoreductase [Paraburkholderia sp. HP33-1]|uniref:SDR family NAD(P)-dependent oxidoreductase n=1 Tax=Paraburkholderia sp. HP33-1 TaxID=2883243 RepID=UPI001F3DF646|nr:SDR family oxidoreductase [Paraburkholderia sp. HP33-1]